MTFGVLSRWTSAVTTAVSASAALSAGEARISRSSASIWLPSATSAWTLAACSACTILDSWCGCRSTFSAAVLLACASATTLRKRRVTNA